jgi:2-polyprenyl-3-methyl-5-hydroxy-6-metoxy-1,4-benzoquinol methylase
MDLQRLEVHAHCLDVPIIVLVPDELAGKRILDLGCGLGYWGYALKTMGEGVPWVTGLDLFQDYIDRIAPLGIYDELVVHDVTRLPLPFENDAFDITISTEILEHIPKEAGAALMPEIERITKSLIIQSTPNGFYAQAGEPWGNEAMTHVCGWTEDEMRAAGYTVTKFRTPELTSRYTAAVEDLRRRVLGISERLEVLICSKTL